jgi:hypothetical protein
MVMLAAIQINEVGMAHLKGQALDCLLQGVGCQNKDLCPGIFIRTAAHLLYK